MWIKVIQHSAKLSINVNGHNVALGKFIPIAGPNMLHTPTHVRDVDDILIFCKGIKKEVQAL
ncbi:hypothetical protein Lal_00022672 [Lupinus albus]|nr:hypothetical protein Lal_00022672 [Lupinus albus]